jgi:hypothetical protein
MSAIGGPATVTSGLVLELDAGNIKSYPTTGTTWFDKSGNARNGTLTNGPTFNTGSLGSIVFDGVNDYMQGSFTALSTYTINVWFKRTGVQSDVYPTLIAFDAYQPGFYLEFNNNDTVSYYQAGLSFPNGVLTFFPLSDIALNTWVNISFTKSGTTISSYLNGTFKSSITDNTTTGTTYALNADRGNSSPASTTQWGGNISQVQIYNRSLSASEVQQNFNATRARFGI